MCTSRKSFCTDEIYAWFCGAADTFIEKVTVPALAKASKVPAYVPREVRRQWDKFTQVAAMLNKRNLTTTNPLNQEASRAQAHTMSHVIARMPERMVARTLWGVHAHMLACTRI